MTHTALASRIFRSSGSGTMQPSLISPSRRHSRHCRIFPMMYHRLFFSSSVEQMLEINGTLRVVLQSISASILRFFSRACFSLARSSEPAKQGLVLALALARHPSVHLTRLHFAYASRQISVGVQPLPSIVRIRRRCRHPTAFPAASVPYL